MRLKRLKASSLLLAGTIFLGAAAAIAADPGPSTALRTGDAFVMPSLAEPSNLIPFLASDGASAEVSRFIFNGLLKYDKDLKLAGDLAESWEVLDGGLTIVFKLRGDIRWQDGYRMTARDVVFTYLCLTDPDVPTPYGSAFEKVESVLAPDDRTVRVTYKEPFSPGLASWTMGIVPMHILVNQDLRKTDFAKNPIGTGPYALKRWVRGEVIELRANPGYFEGAPNIERVVFRVLPDPATVFLELQSGSLDSAGLSPLQYNRQIDTPFFRKNYRSYRWNGQQYTFLAYNQKDTRFADKRVRQAIGLALDRRQIIDSVLMGRGRPLSGPFLPDSWAYDADVKPFDDDAERARALLAEAGWTDTDKDGWLDKDGRKFSFAILTNGANDQRRMVCEVIQRQLAAVGIQARIQTMEWSVLLKEFIHPRRFEAVLLGWNLALDPDVFDIFHSSRAKPGQFNFISFNSAEGDRLLEEARSTFDMERRAELYKRFHALVNEEQPYAFLFTSESLTVLHKRFQGVTEGKIGFGFDFVKWSVPEDAQKYRWADG
jgi:peptide/nickel transport system substrate-binding protein